MIGSSLRIFSILALASACLLSLPANTKAASSGDDASAKIKAARSALEQYQDPIAAVRNGYYSTVACIDFPKGGTMDNMLYPAGGMGVHLINPALIGAKLDPTRPQVLIYEPVADKLHLVAAEWFVPLATGIKERPEMFGHLFYGPMEGHYPIMPASLTHYDLHVWLWKDNPAGMFVPTNPDVKCPAGAYTVHGSMPKMITGHR